MPITPKMLAALKASRAGKMAPVPMRMDEPESPVEAEAELTQGEEPEEMDAVAHMEAAMKRIKKMRGSDHVHGKIAVHHLKAAHKKMRP